MRHFLSILYNFFKYNEFGAVTITYSGTRIEVSKKDLAKIVFAQCILWILFAPIYLIAFAYSIIYIIAEKSYNIIDYLTQKVAIPYFFGPLDDFRLFLARKLEGFLV